MATIIEILLEEIWIICPICGGFGEIAHWNTGAEKVCPECDGRCHILSDDGAKLRHLLKHGEMP